MKSILVSALLTLVPLTCDPTSGVPAADTVQQATVGDALVIPAIGLHRPIVIGGQRQIDGGHIVNFVDGPPLCWPDQGCTIWLTGHRTSSGGPFRALANLTVGAIVSIHHDGVAADFTVVEKAVYPRNKLGRHFFRHDLMLQTSWTSGRIMVFYAVRVAA